LIRGDFLLVKHDHIGYRYQILDIIGRGSFGQVAKAYDHKKKVNCAIKIIKGKDKFYNQALVEI
jgi:dual specificity tyrosine-phosphorylation-regulated kinase 2/3/4